VLWWSQFWRPSLFSLEQQTHCLAKKQPSSPLSSCLIAIPSHLVSCAGPQGRTKFLGNLPHSAVMWCQDFALGNSNLVPNVDCQRDLLMDLTEWKYFSIAKLTTFSSHPIQRDIFTWIRTLFPTEIIPDIVFHCQTILKPFIFCSQLSALHFAYCSTVIP